jgi:glycosyltransferase involved in cell wall biosynthesis
MDYLPILLALNLNNKVPIYVPNHDASTWENIIYKTNASTETPYRIVDLADKIFRTEANIISQSEYATNKFKEFNPNLNVITLPIPLNKNIEMSENLPFEHTKDILWVGASTSFKNPKLLLKIADALPEFKITAIFNSRNKAQITKAKNKFSRPNITILGSQSQEELIKLYQSHRTGIITSTIETFCIVAQEKQLFMPTFVWDKSINKFHNIFPGLIPFDNAENLAATIRNKYNDVDFYTNTVNANRITITQQYNIDKIKPLYFDFIKQLKQELLSKNNFLNLNNLGAYVSSKLLVVPEYSWESAINHFKYNDYVLAQHSIFSQLHKIKKKDTKRGSFFVR